VSSYSIIDSLLFGFIASIPLLIGSVVAMFVNFPRQIVASIMAFGSGVLIAALSFSLMQEAFEQSQSLISVILGFLFGGVSYTLANCLLNKRSKGELRKRKKSHGDVAGGGKDATGLALLVGSVMDNIPENMALGISLVTGGVVNIVLIAAIFISNFPEGLASSSGMLQNGKSRKHVIGLWLIAVVIGTASTAIGYSILSKADSSIVSIAISFAAGAILVMLAESMMPEAYEEGGMKVGIATMIGFGIAFILGKISGG
jgi:ZIP family zinc transporter